MSILIIVESPKKAKTLQGYLGDAYRVAASGGHIRDLPRRELGVAADTYQLHYALTERAAQTVPRLKQWVKNASAVYLATDPDREGEAISWHLAQVLHLKQPRRITFQAVSKAAILAALQAPRALDLQLIQAQEARRAIDRLVGWKVSPALSQRLNARAAAGRVQSPALHLVVLRERAIRAFQVQPHFEAVLTFAGAAGDWQARWHFAPLLDPAAPHLWLEEGRARVAAGQRQVTVRRCISRTQPEAPPAPFKTSTLQQAASIKLRLDPARTMALAQELCDGGLITYHRTDSENFSDETLQTLRAWLAQQGLPVSTAPRRRTADALAQEAHEAIHPVDIAHSRGGESPEAQALYALIRTRTLASQLAAAEYAVTEVWLEAADGTPYIARGRQLTVPGWRQLADSVVEDEDAAPIAANPVPTLAEGTTLVAKTGDCVRHRTQPPKRYTQASLVRALETAGIGRPSTYAAILSGLTGKGYLAETQRRLSPTPLGEQINDALAGQFSFIQLDYTRRLEKDLDRIAAGEARYRTVVAAADADLTRELNLLPTATATPFPCPACGQSMQRRQRKKDQASFWGCSGYPACKVTAEDQDGKPNFRDQR